MGETKSTFETGICCNGLFYAHIVNGGKPLVVLECSTCGRLWHQREDRRIVPYDRTLLPVLRNAE